MIMPNKITRTELTHHGILGMKWGIRRYQPYPKGEGKKGKFTGRQEKRQEKKEQKLLGKAQKKWDEQFNKEWYKAYNNAANYANAVLIPEVNKKYGKYDWTKLDTTDFDNPKGDPKLVDAYKKYTNEYETKFNEVLQKEYDIMFGKRPGE